MRLIDDWKQTALYSYSMWASYLGIFLLILPELLFFYWGIETNPRLLWGLSLALILIGNIFGRIFDQNGFEKKDKWPVIIGVLLLLFVLLWPAVTRAETHREPPTAAQTLKVAVPLIAKWEGLRLHAYQDIVGVWTVCYGETKGVKPSDVYTKRQCDAMLKAEVASYRAAIFRHYTPETKASRLTPQRDAAFVSLGYNVGTAQVGRSTAMRRLNAGDIKGACVATTWYNRAGQRVIRGLVNRRAEEYSCCVYDLVPEEQRVCL